jgi:homoserine kinase
MKMTPCRIQLSAPSTSANLGPGFDCLGIALAQRNIWTVSVVPGTQPGHCRVTDSVGGGAHYAMPDDERHLFFASWKKLADMGLGPNLFALLADSGLEIELSAQNVTPIARGLGSSAAVRVASAEVYRRLTGVLERPAWELGAQLEGHPDNAGPAGLGGLFLGAKDSTGRYRALQPMIHPCWQLAVAIPDFTLHTKKARAVLPTELSRADAIFNMGHLPFLLEGLRTGDSDFLSLGCQDRWHQNQRAALIPGFYQVLQAALEAGGAAAFLSGAGPTMACFVDQRRGTDVGPKVAQAMGRVFGEHNVKTEVTVLTVDQTGLQVLELEPEQQLA